MRRTSTSPLALADTSACSRSQTGAAQVMPHGPRKGPASHYRAVIVATGENCTPLRRSIVLLVGGDDAAVEFGGDEVNDDPFHDPSRTRRIKTG